MVLWKGVEPEPYLRLGPFGWLRLGLRLFIYGVVTLELVLLWALAKLLEKAVGGDKMSGAVVRLWARVGHSVLGLRLEIQGQEMTHGGAIVANHTSWTDIFVLHSAAHIHFVSKAEVAGWPVIGWLARITGTLFIERKSSEAPKQQVQLAARISTGDKLCVFPEATSTDGLRVLPFKTTIFGVFHTEELKDLVWVQPVTVAYFPPKGKDKRFYGWWGDMDFADHAKVILGLSMGGRVRVIFHDPLKAADFDSRKDLAKAADEIVRNGLRKALGDKYEESA
ncbi:MAG: 1-acyl-sn-glycerol-3-phosphate acyltransferase [Rhodobacteraceae bacterium]|nr:1-acyl-sn-glycerol-3-phosphate acyltransferase [Paracoccaceae bacterium]